MGKMLPEEEEKQRERPDAEKDHDAEAYEAPGDVTGGLVRDQVGGNQR